MMLPLVDFAGCPDPGAAIDEALATSGFLQLTNIGIAPDLLEMVFQESKAFFESSADTRRRCAYGSASENFGYQGLLEENLDPAAPADLKQTFTMRNIINRPPPGERWPSPEFRDLMQRFYAAALTAAHAIQHRMAQTLGLVPDHFTRVHSGENVTLRLLHYPSGGVPEPALSQLGAGAHTDYGFLTLLFQRDVGGLQVIDSTGTWIDVPPRADAVIVNSGDLLERWTNGRYRSTMHRVIAMTGERDRLSIAMFVDPDSDTVVEALPSCVAGENAVRFPAITAGEHLQSKLEASHKGRFAQ